ncbi:helix-turn-helix domain-containing protein [Ligilactobacillus acidipiscis]|uniref:helix-turn-helix domain-containing protein n=1 Tax=Ligilactobacillus acidipiscis TaxID=89059 RepID=UPI0022E115DE|nr:helix-turn-helix transcriptional regulator [Ligilactobacillus acidipiscis]
MAEQNLIDAAYEVKDSIMKQLRARGMTQKDLAQKMKIDRIYVSRAINGDVSPRSIKIRKQIYKVLGME